jgi:hypothetical protein
MDNVIGFGALGLLCVGLPAAAVALLYFTIFAPQRRKRKRLVAAGAEWAQRHGWSHQPHDHSLYKRWQGEPFKNKGGAEDILYGSHRGWQVLMFNYGFAYSGAVTHGTRNFTVVAVTLAAPRPWLQLIPRESARSEQFYDVFELNSQDPRFSTTVLQPEMENWMLNDERARELPLRFEGTELLTWGAPRTIGDGSLEMADYLIDFLERVPPEALR